jgi:hypothetical protein
VKLTSFEALVNAGAAILERCAPGNAGRLFVHEPFDFDEEYRRATRKALGRMEVGFVSIPTLIRMKEAAGRPEDKIDIEYLRVRLKDSGEQ